MLRDDAHRLVERRAMELTCARREPNVGYERRRLILCAGNVVERNRLQRHLHGRRRHDNAVQKSFRVGQVVVVFVSTVAPPNLLVAASQALQIAAMEIAARVFEGYESVQRVLKAVLVARAEERLWMLR